MNEYLRLFIYVRERLVTCSFMFDSSLVFLVFTFYLNTSKFRQINYLISVGVLYILFMNTYFVRLFPFVFMNVVSAHLCSSTFAA
ncbi:hypothetical protein Hanom_Chr01g00017771 [Helianthus anomalus]